ncbi:Dynein heavy chain 5, axonemal [Liparis tanakae]|uniref:Dynein heavy chain 5, axonemal n=1 Tax=Liparis tanakae TaxID=230148 RepID=A0A4Z2E3R0_9TELE|nr:Dynein heavy chain 5, axonemal [Liparis tanakae]
MKDLRSSKEPTVSSLQPLLGRCLFFLRTTDKAITTANVQQVCSAPRPQTPDPPDPRPQTPDPPDPPDPRPPLTVGRCPPVKEVTFGMLDCGEGVGLLQGLETLLAQVMVPALRSQQIAERQPNDRQPVTPDLPPDLPLQAAGRAQAGGSFLASVDRFLARLSSAKGDVEGRFRLRQLVLPDAVQQLSGPADYTAAANDSELVERLEGVASEWTNQIKQVLTESEQMRKEADDVGPSAELEHWKRRMVTFTR